MRIRYEAYSTPPKHIHLLSPSGNDVCAGLESGEICTVGKKTYPHTVQVERFTITAAVEAVRAKHRGA